MALEAFAVHANRIAWSVRTPNGPSHVLTYGQLRDCVAYQVNQIQATSLPRRAKIGVLLPNGPEWSIAALAVWLAGGVMVPLHTNNTRDELTEQLDVLGLDAVFALPGQDIPSSLPVLTVSVNDCLLDYKFKLQTGSDDDLAALFYTSGSTGKSKVVQLSHRNFVSNVIMSTEAIGTLDSSDRFMVLLPFSHAMGLTVQLLVPVYLGASMVAPTKLAAKEIIDCLSQEGVSVMLAVPQLYRNMMHSMEKKFAASKLLSVYIALIRAVPVFLKKLINKALLKNFGPIKLWGSGGSRLDPGIMDYFQKLGFPLVQGYGLTETTPILCIGTVFDDVLDTVGYAVPGVEARLVEIPGHNAKELWVRGENIMLGYTDAAMTAEVLIPDENDPEGLPWLRTGDLVTMDAKGRITIVGRSKRLIVTETGKNVYPEDLEVQLEQDNSVKEACVVEYQGTPGAVIALADDVKDPEVTLKQVMRSFNDRVAAHKKIRKFMQVSALPRTALGKIALVKVQEMLRDSAPE